MWKLLNDFWRDDRGCVAATEWVFVASILTLGTLAGLVVLHSSRDVVPFARPPMATR